MKDSIVLNKSKAKNMAKNNLVVKSNQVVEASYALTTLEQRLILSVIAQIPKGQEVSDDVLYPISIETVVKLGGDANIFYTNIKEALNRLYDRSIVLRIWMNQRLSDGFNKSEKRSQGNFPFAFQPLSCHFYLISVPNSQNT